MGPCLPRHGARGRPDRSTGAGPGPLRPTGSAHAPAAAGQNAGRRGPFCPDGQRGGGSARRRRAGAAGCDSDGGQKQLLPGASPSA